MRNHSVYNTATCLRHANVGLAIMTAVIAAETTAAGGAKFHLRDVLKPLRLKSSIRDEVAFAKLRKRIAKALRKRPLELASLSACVAQSSFNLPKLVCALPEENNTCEHNKNQTHFKPMSPSAKAARQQIPSTPHFPRKLHESLGEREAIFRFGRSWV